MAYVSTYLTLLEIPKIGERERERWIDNFLEYFRKIESKSGHAGLFFSFYVRVVEVSLQMYLMIQLCRDVCLLVTFE